MTELWTPSDGPALFDRVQAIREAAAYYSPCRLFDVAAGDCSIPLALQADGFDVRAFDISRSRARPEAARIFQHGNALELDYSQCDLIVCAGLLYHLPIEHQIRLVSLWRSKPVILDTHVSIATERCTVTKSGLEYEGQHRVPTWSSRAGRCFVHTPTSLMGLMGDWKRVGLRYTTADRMTCQFAPQD